MGLRERLGVGWLLGVVEEGEDMVEEEAAAEAAAEEVVVVEDHTAVEVQVVSRRSLAWEVRTMGVDRGAGADQQ